MKAVTVSVSYGDVLALTLPRNRLHFRNVVVVTSPDDAETQAVARAAGAELFITDLFFRDGATFNKGRAIDAALRQVASEPDFDDWLAVVDADTLLPEMGVCWNELKAGSIYGARRRMLRDLAAYGPGFDWRTAPVNPERELPGFLHVWHIDDPHTPGRGGPLYPVHWAHAGGVDSEHAMQWPTDRRVKLFEVLHLGEDGKNWCGRTTVRRDGTRPVEADARAAALKSFLSRRAGRVFPYYDHEQIATPE